jgi:subtilisin family serine protease
LAIGGYTTRSGTSMAVPHVAGLAAVLWNGSAANVRWSIESTALDIDLPGWDPYSGAGLIQMDAALGAPPAPTATFTPTATFMAIANGAFDSAPHAPYNNPPDASLTGTPLPAEGTTPTVTPTYTATATSTASPTTTKIALNTPTPEGEIIAQSAVQSSWRERLKVFISPLFCGGTLLILTGLIWAWMMQRRQRARN